MDRRHFLAGLFALTALSCGVDIGEKRSTSQTPQNETTSQLEELLAARAPALARELRDYRGPFNRKLLLTQFLWEASNNAKLAHELPLVVLPERNQIGYAVRQFTLDEQLRLLRSTTYRFLDWTGGKDRLVVMSSHKTKLSATRIDEVYGVFAPLAVQVGSFFEDINTSPWLHLQFFEQGRFNYTAGYNIMFTNTAEAYPNIFAHEMVHTYNWRWNRTTPAFIHEGLPEIISYLITGQAGLLPYATGKRVHLGVIPLSAGAATLEEGGNGLLFFMELVRAIGRDAFQAGVSRAFRTQQFAALDLLGSIKNASLEKEVVENIYVKWVEDYTPKSA